MIHYARLGRIADRAHKAMKEGDRLIAEHVFTREGFSDLYSILYQRRAPTHESEVTGFDAGPDGFCPGPAALPAAPERQHFRSGSVLARPGLGFLQSRKILMTNSDCTVGVCHLAPGPQDFFVNGDADDLFFVTEGAGTLETMFGLIDVRLHDYVLVPRGVPYRFVTASPLRLFCVEAFRGFGIPREFLNHRGQLRLDAPYNERDFRRPEKLIDTSSKTLPSSLIVCRNRTLSKHVYTEWPYDVLGWDGYVWPFAFNVHDYKPKTSTYHLPPTSHAIFEAKGFVVMNFVPRLVDYGPDAIPCPYPHSSIDCDEVLYYADGDFTSRKGIEKHSISFHPGGIPHGPHPTKYEMSLGLQRTDELAIMVDTFAPLSVTEQGRRMAEADYHFSWNTKEHL
jgi:homogentisate 1,2-dioxygenase